MPEEINKVKISKVRGDINYILYDVFNFDLEHLKLSNQIMDMFGGGSDERQQ